MMANECTVDVISKPNHWLRIVQNCYHRRELKLMALNPDIRVHDTRFFKRVLQQGSLGLGESYMEGWWDCKRLDIFFDKLLRAHWTNNALPVYPIFCASRLPALLTHSHANAPGKSAKCITTWAMISLAACSIPTCNTPAATGKRPMSYLSPRKTSWR
jgi:hypothetical protein